MPRNELRFAQWTELALGEGTIRLFDDWTWVYFDLDWGGFLSRVRPWINDRVSDTLLSQSPEEWVSKYVYYAEIPDSERREMLASDEGSDYLSDLTLLKTFPVSDGWSGEDIHVYDLRDIEPINDIVLGEQIELIGYNLSAEQISPGEDVAIQFFWRAVQRPNDNYQVYLHLVSNRNLDILAQVDATPATASYQTSLWVDPQEVISGRVFVMTIPDELPPGQYRLIMGLYELDTFKRLETQSGDDYVVIDNIEVVE